MKSPRPMQPLWLAVIIGGCSGARSELQNDASTYPDATPSGVLINEVAAAGEPSDWIEIFNPGEQPIQLERLLLADGNDFAVAKPLPASQLAPGGYQAVYVNSEVFDFSLGSDEEAWLFNNSGDVIDFVDWAEGQSESGGSFARNDDGEFVSTTCASPGELNTICP